MAVDVESEALYLALRKAGIEETPARQVTQVFMVKAVLEPLVTAGDLEPPTLPAILRMTADNIEANLTRVSAVHGDGR